MPLLIHRQEIVSSLDRLIFRQSKLQDLLSNPFGGEGEVLKSLPSEVFLSVHKVVIKLCIYLLVLCVREILFAHYYLLLTS